MSIDDSMHSLFGVSKAAADLMVQEYGRYFDMPTVCFRGGCLTGPEPRRGAAARLPLLPDALHGHRRAVHVFGYGGKQVRDNIHSADLVRAFEAFHARAAAGRRLQHRRRARQQLLDARGDRALRARSPAASSTGRCSDQARMGDHRWWISDLARVPGATTRTGSSSTTSRRSCARSTTQNVERWSGRGVKLSVVIPAHNEAGSIAATVDGARRPRSSGEGIDYEIIVVDDAQHRRDRARSSSALARGEPARALPPLALPAAASASPCAPGSSASRATPWRS